MNADCALFPVWQRWSGCVFPVYRRVIYQVPDTDRQVVGYLSLSGDVAHLTLRWDERDQLVAVVWSGRAEGIGSLPRAIQWAEWVCADRVSGGPPRRRARGGAKRASVQKEAA